ncbi:Uncharacterised protein [Amycolatopsis camponoti]|uniref:Smf/DprA SLOG domain-containing protein n=1 Tax=Amycolatopsis camponoti TaxID=2606593 RepID=A0A6I8M1Y5_9PSEU|nr:hypothetical protein [Amycolatopsis camponoti]VVJ21606.1 Uncharacterised protein [Amycolatopsis camponoti]
MARRRLRRPDELAAARSVTICGAQAATEYGEHHASEPSRDIAVWSGAAYSIDGAGRRGALAAHRPAATVAVLAASTLATQPGT